MEVMGQYPMAKQQKVTLIELGGALYLSASDAEMFLEGLSGDINADDVGFAKSYHGENTDSMFSVGKLLPSREKLLEEILTLTIKASRADAAGESLLYSRLIKELISQLNMLKLADQL